MVSPRSVSSSSGPPKRESFVQVVLRDPAGGDSHGPKRPQGPTGHEPSKTYGDHGHDGEGDPRLDEKLVKVGCLLGLETAPCRAVGGNDP